MQQKTNLPEKRKQMKINLKNPLKTHRLSTKRVLFTKDQNIILHP